MAAESIWTICAIFGYLNHLCLNVIALNAKYQTMCVFRARNGWWWVPVAGPMVGGVVGAGIYFLMIELHHPEPEKNLEDDNSVKDKYELNTVN